jgi:hypothetical protein
MPSPRAEDEYVVFCDASSGGLGALLCQMMPKKEHLDHEWNRPKGTNKYLFLIRFWSKGLPATKRSLPHFLKEFLSFHQIVKKYAFLLSARTFKVVTDSSTVQQWANYDLLPDDIVLKIIYFHQFDFKLVFLETRMHPADLPSRLENNQDDDGVYCERFLHNRIYNSQGKQVPLESLLCKEIEGSLRDYFSWDRKQQQSRYRGILDPAFVKQAQIKIKN